jgi:hypothetical protein
MQELKRLILTPDFLDDPMATIFDASDLFVERVDIAARVSDMVNRLGLTGRTAPEQLIRPELLKFIERSTYLRQDVVFVVAMGQLAEFGVNRLQIALEVAQRALRRFDFTEQFLLLL